MITTGTLVTLKQNPNFRGRVLAITPSGKAYLSVISWGGEMGGWRRKLALNHTTCEVDELEEVFGKN